MSVLAHVVLGGALQNEPAATQALAYILKSSPDIARAFVGMLRDAGIEFEPGRIEAELEHQGSQPDLTIHDSEGHARVFVENKFWAGLTDAQPVSYLGHLPEDPPSALMFIVPEQRVATVWNELKDRCTKEGLEWTDALGAGAAIRARIGCKTMSVASWRYVLDRLLDAARAGGHDTIAHDILQLQGLTEQMDSEAFLPLRADEVTDQETARRLVNYVDLMNDIVQKLKDNGIIDTTGFSVGNGPHYTGRFFSFSVHEKLQTWFGFDRWEWLAAGITPLWWWFDSKSGVTADHFKTSPELFKDVSFHKDGQYVPIYLKTGVERDRVVEDAAARMRRISDDLLEKIRNG